jgi:hypothetical protein
VPRRTHRSRHMETAPILVVTPEGNHTPADVRYTLQYSVEF